MDFGGLWKFRAGNRVCLTDTKGGLPSVWTTYWFITFTFLSKPFCNEYAWESDEKAQTWLMNFAENFFSFLLQPLPPLPPSFSSSQQKSEQEASTVSTTTQTTCISMIKPATSVASTTTPTGVVKPTPSIAVTQTQSIEREEKTLMALSQRSKQTSPSKRKDIKKHPQHKSKHSTLDRTHRWELTCFCWIRWKQRNQ